MKIVLKRHLTMAIGSGAKLPRVLPYQSGLDLNLVFHGSENYAERKDIYQALSVWSRRSMLRMVEKMI